MCAELFTKLWQELNSITPTSPENLSQTRLDELFKLSRISEVTYPPVTSSTPVSVSASASLAVYSALAGPASVSDQPCPLPTEGADPRFASGANAS